MFVDHEAGRCPVGQFWRAAPRDGVAPDGRKARQVRPVMLWGFFVLSKTAELIAEVHWNDLVVENSVLDRLRVTAVNLERDNGFFNSYDLLSLVFWKHSTLKQ